MKWEVSSSLEPSRWVSCSISVLLSASRASKWLWERLFFLIVFITLLRRLLLVLGMFFKVLNSIRGVSSRWTDLVLSLEPVRRDISFYINLVMVRVLEVVLKLLRVLEGALRLGFLRREEDEV